MCIICILENTLLSVLSDYESNSTDARLAEECDESLEIILPLLTFFDSLYVFFVFGGGSGVPLYISCRYTNDKLK